MRIEKIELIGFKSFSEKTVFDFHPGITAVVGPNGCGKSNIVDAFKWVLGEQSAKSLRGDRMEDVVFSGSASKKPKGMAEVTLVISGISNGDTALAGEASVTRRLYRSGESEYLLNKVPCRLKDIKTLFLDTGLELKTYSILEQGRMDAILNSKPHERRFLIEEVAGVMKYNVRKAEALQKLDASQSNLLRLQDIISEVKRQISAIDRYAKRAEKYKKLFDEIKNIEIKIAARDYAVFSAELKGFSASENLFTSREAEFSTHIHSADVLIEEKKLLCTEKEKTLDEMQEKLHAAERGIIEEEGRISLLKSDCENLRNRLQRLIARDDEFTGGKENINAQIENIKQKNTEMGLELSNTEEILNSRKEAVSAIEKEIDGLEQGLENSRKNIFNKAQEISTLKNEINNFSMMIENLDRKGKKSIEEINSVKEGISSLDASIKEAKDEHSRFDMTLKEKAESKDGLLKDINNKRKELGDKEEELYKDREDYAAMISRLESLKELDTGGKSAVKEHVKILCQVADIFETPPEYETAIEAALGDKLSAAVVEDQHEIMKALEFIKEQKVNRSGFISVNPADRRLDSPTGNISNGANVSPAAGSAAQISNFSGDVIGKAIDFVKVKNGFDKIAGLLLNDVIIVNNLSKAFDLWHKSFTNSAPGYFVTLDGDVLEPAGIVFGGTEKGLLKIKREIKELQKNTGGKRSRISSTETEISSLKNNIAVIEDNLLSVENEISQIEKSHHEQQLKIAGLQEEKSRQEKKLEYISIEIDGDRKEKEDIENALSGKNEICSVMDNEKCCIEKEMEEVQKNIGGKKTVLEMMRSELTEKMLSRAAIKEKMDSLMREGDSLNSRLSEMEKKKQEIFKERHEIETSIKQKEGEIKEKENSLKSSVVMISKLKEDASKVKEILEAKTAELNLLEKQQKTYLDELTAIRKELAHVEVKKTELSMKITHLMEDIRKTYSIELERLISGQEQLDPLLPEEEDKLHDLRERFQELGPVNLGTLEELEELKARHDFLTKQQNDLLQAIQSLQETILKINKTTQKRLSDAFEALNEKFKDVFTILFGKGKAELILTEGSILDAGIEIVAQPPGKKLQSLMLLSGGEKALTALSLLFAGFMIKPTPLCILDEVDAPLDESNTERFALLLTDLAKNIQFVTITHNRRTMEAADYLYGITMEEPGISKVVSMQLAEAV
jgi:chromosome segregation protein